MTRARQRLLDEITSLFLRSHDFKGAPLAVLVTAMSLDWTAIRPDLIRLVREEYVGVLFSDSDENPHILRFAFEPVDAQVRKLRAVEDLRHACAYPQPKHLRNVVAPSSYEGRPFTLELALGEPQLSYCSFDLSVLETYRNDPRYWYQNNDVEGSISVHDEFYESEDMLERDQVLLQSFGFAYDAEFNRAVAVFLRYLSHLSPEHQQVWKARQLPDHYKLHPDYYRNSIVGDWGVRRASIFVALLVELSIINRMAKAMGRPPLFRKDFGPDAENKPRQFTFLVRPTLEELSDFTLLLDKMLSDNIDKRFFRGEVAAEIEEERPDGKIVVRPKGTLLMLDEWLRKKMRLPDWEPWETALAALREVRKLRQKPAHAVDENVFDQKYLKRQRDIVVRAYQAVRTIRLLLANYPATKDIEIPDWLYKGLIWDF